MVAKTNENIQIKKIEEVYEIDIGMLDNFKDHPYGIREDEKYLETRDSIAQVGVTTPLLVRPKGKDKYEIISGHRRKHICEEFGITKIPCIIRDMDNDTATILMVDCNAQRDTVLPSEKSKAYKMKYEALKRQGKRNDLTSSQVGTKLRADEIMAQETGESRNQIQRWIHLGELIPELMQMVDDGRIAFSPAVEISYLYKNEQMMLLKMIEMFDHTPSLSQAQELRRLSKNYELNEDTMEDLMSEEKPNQIPKINISYGRIQHYVPRNVVTPKEVEDYLIKCAIVCQQRGINIEKLDIKIDKPKEVDRDSR